MFSCPAETGNLETELKQIDFVESLPKNTNGKIRCSELRAMELKELQK